MEQMGDDIDDDAMDNMRPHLMGKASAVVDKEDTAKEIIDDMVGDAVKWLAKTNNFVVSKSSL